MTVANGAKSALVLVPARWRRRGAALIVAAGIAVATVGLSGSSSPAVPPSSAAGPHISAPR